MPEDQTITPTMNNEPPTNQVESVPAPSTDDTNTTPTDTGTIEGQTQGETPPDGDTSNVSTSDTASNLFDLNADIDDEPTPQDGDNIEDEPFDLTIDEKYGIREDVTKRIAVTAKKHGVPADAISAAINEIASDCMEDATEQFNGHAKRLESLWGDGFGERVKDSRTFLIDMSKRAGLNKDELGLLGHPVVFKLMDTIRQSFDEGGTKGLKEARAHNNGAAASDIIKNPNNPLYNAYYGLAGTSAAEQRAARTKVNQLKGFNFA